MGVKVTNNGFGTISAGITSSATTIVLDSGQGARFPALASGDFFFGTLVDTSNNIEIIKVTARSSDSMTVTRAQDNTSARAFSVGDRFELRPTAALFENAHLDNTPTSTGSIGLPKGTTAQQPTASATEGHIRYDTDKSAVVYSDGSAWYKVSSVIPTLSGVTGNYYVGTSASLTLAGTGFLSSNLIVTFTHSATDRTVTVSPTSDTAATVTTPSALDSAISAGDTVTIKVTNSDGTTSGTQNITVSALPTGGSISNAGGYRIHTFNSSANFVAPGTLSAEILIVAGGGGGGSSGGEGGGAGAGGLIYYGAETPKTPTGSAVSISSGTYAVTVGAGGTGSPTYAPRTNTDGGNSSVGGLSLTTAVGGGSGGCYPGNGTGQGNSGGSGGGGGGNSSSGGSTAGGAGTSGQGFAGGNGGFNVSSQFRGGGGGGASEVGESPLSVYGSTFRAGDGGDGLAYSITGSSVAYAGGGGGNTNGGTGGIGGSGGGGNNG